MHEAIPLVKTAVSGWEHIARAEPLSPVGEIAGSSRKAAALPLLEAQP